MRKFVIVVITIILSFRCLVAETRQDSTIQNLSLPPYDIEFEYQQEKNKVKNVSTNADWISIQKKKNKSGTYFIIQIAENTSDQERNSTLTIKTSKRVESIVITQEGQNITKKFSDHHFRQALFDKGIISNIQTIYAREVRDLLTLDLSDVKNKIRSISGIEYFQKLRDLDCSFQRLRVIDLSRNKYIEKLICSNQFILESDGGLSYTLTSIQLPDQYDKNTKAKFRELDYSYNPNGAWDRFDIGSLPWLERLNCSREVSIGNRRAPTVSFIPNKNPGLKELICRGCRLTNLNLSFYKDLEILDCSSNKLDTIDITHNKKLLKLTCDSQWHNIGETYRTYYSSFIYISDPTDSIFALEELYCRYNSLSALDLSKFSHLRIVDCSQNKLDKLDFSKNYKLERIVCNTQSKSGSWYYRFNSRSEPYGDTLTSLVLPDRPENALETLICYGNILASLDLSNCLFLDSLHCAGNKIKSLDLSSCAVLSYLNCCDAGVEQLNISKCEQLTTLNCSENIGMAELDVHDCIRLRELNCSYCTISSLDVSNNSNLEKLYCIKQANRSTIFENGRGGALKVLILPESSDNKLKEFDCNDNRLTTLDIYNCPNLTKVNCSWNRLTQLDVSHNLLLSEIDCEYSYIQYLDFSNNGKLEKLKCGGQGYEWMWREGHVFKRLKKLILPYNDIKDSLQELDYHASDLENPVVLENLPELKTLNCSESRLASINLGGNKKLQRLQINNNHLTSLDLSGNPELIHVNCISNRFDEIDISNNPLLKKLTCIHSNNENKKFTIWVGNNYTNGSVDFRPNYSPHSLEKLIIKKVVGK